MLKEFIVNRFYGGISEDDTLTRDSEVMYSYNVDLLSNSDFINVAQAIDHKFTTPSQCIYTINIEGNIFFLTNTNEVYNVNGNLVYNTSNKVIGHFVGGEHLFLIDIDYTLYKISISTIIANDWTPNITTNSLSITGTAPEFIPAISDAQFAFLAVNKKIYQYDVVGGNIIADSLFQISSPIVGLIRDGATIKIFCENGTVFLRDGVVDGEKEEINLGNNITAIKQISNTVYVFGEGTIYILNGYTLQPIRTDVNSMLLNSAKTDINITKGLEFLVDKTLIYFTSDTAVDIETEDGDIKFNGKGLSSIGNKRAGFPNALNNLLYSNNITNIYGIILEGNDLYVAYQDINNSYIVGSIDVRGIDYNTGQEGLIILPTFNGYSNEKHIKKNLYKIKVIADLGNSLDNQIIITELGNNRKLNYLGFDKASSTIAQLSAGEGIMEYEIIANKNIYKTNLGIVIKNNTENTITNNVRIYSIIYEYELIE